MKIVLAGFYGCGNLGDEAILEALIAGIRKNLPLSDIMVLSGSPSDTSLCYNVSAINRTDLKSIFKQIKSCDVFMLGGGGILQDATSSRSLYYYLFLIWIAKRLKKKVMLIGQGIGPIRNPINRFMVKKVVKNIQLLTVRDAASLEEARRLSLKCGKITLTSDLAFSLNAPDDQAASRLLEIEGIKRCKEHLVGVALRKKPGNQNEEWLDKMAAALDEISGKDCQVVFLVFHCPDDMGIAKSIMGRMKSPAHIVFRNCKPSEMLGIISKLDLLIGMRLHSLIFAAIASTPMVGLSYDPKVTSLMGHIKAPCLDISSMKYDVFVKTCEHALSGLDTNRASLKLIADQLKKVSELNYVLLKQAVEKEKIDIMGIGIDDVGMQGAVKAIEKFIESKSPHLITSSNPEILLEAQRDMELKEVLNSAGLNLPDGVGVLIASRLKGLPIKERVTGIDLMLELLEFACQNSYGVFLLGGKEGIAEKAETKLKDKFPKLKVVGTYHGYFKNDAMAIDLIKRASPDILFVGMGSPRQEKWGFRHLRDLNIPVVVMIGGSLDVLSGELKRAPLWMRRSGIEWLYRVIREPGRLRRISKLPVFLLKALKS